MSKKLLFLVMNHFEDPEYTEPVKSFKEKEYENIDITAFFILNFV